MARSTDEAERMTMTVEQASKTLGISRATAYTLARQGRLPAIRISDHRWIIPVKSLMAMLETGVSKEVNNDV